MKYTFFLFFLINVLVIKSQSFGVVFTSGIWTTKNIERELDKEIRKGIKNNVIQQSSKINNGDTLIYNIKHQTDGFTSKYTFNIKDEDVSYCDFEQYIFDCAPCSQKHLKDFIALCDFRKKSDTVYISNYSYKTEMTLSYRSNTKDYLILTFRNSDLSKRNFKKIHRKLPKN